MPIKAVCSSCSHSFSAASKYAGKKVKCPQCKEPLVIPAAGAKAVATSGDAKGQGKAVAKSSGKIAVKCKCGQKFAAKPELSGKKVKCPGCKEPIRIPGGTAAGAKNVPAKVTKKPAKSKAVSTEVSAAPTIDDLFDEVGFNTEDGSAHRKCPECRASMPDEAIICIDCGYNEKTGKKMETYRPVTAEDRAKEADVLATPATMPRRSGKKSSAGGVESEYKLPIISFAVSLGLYLLAAGLMLVDPAFGAMAMLAALAVSFLLALAGGFWLIGIAFGDSVVQGLLCWFVPFYGLFYVATHWEETKVAFLFGAAASLALTIGPLIVAAFAPAL